MKEELSQEQKAKCWDKIVQLNEHFKEAYKKKPTEPGKAALMVLDMSIRTAKLVATLNIEGMINTIFRETVDDSDSNVQKKV